MAYRPWPVAHSATCNVDMDLPGQARVRRGNEPASAKSEHFREDWTNHLVKALDDGRDLVFVSRHVLQETTALKPSRGFERRAARCAMPS